MLGAFAGAGREEEASALFDAVENSEGSIPHRACAEGRSDVLKDCPMPLKVFEESFENVAK